jgi:ABC-type multidrug transport system fused ATPase/permease subunit
LPLLCKYLYNNGKSTLVSLIPRLYDVTAEQILVDGRDEHSLKLDVLRQEVSVVLQEAVLKKSTMLVGG